MSFIPAPALSIADESALRNELTERLVKQRQASVAAEQMDLIKLEARLTCRSLPSRFFTWLGSSGMGFRGDGHTFLMLQITFARLQMFADFTAGGELFVDEQSLQRLDRLSMGIRLQPLRQLMQPATFKEQ